MCKNCTVEAILQPGEFILNATAATLTRATLDAYNERQQLKTAPSDNDMVRDKIRQIRAARANNDEQPET